MKIYILIFFTILLTTSDLAAQFDKKFTLDLGLGYASTIGDEFRDDREPYIYSNFDIGINLLANVQYNLTTQLSVGAYGAYSFFALWYDPRTDEIANGESSLSVVTIGPSAKYKFLKGNISPYVTGALGVTIYGGQKDQRNIRRANFAISDADSEFTSIDDVIIREPSTTVETSSAFGFMTGLGVLWDISQSLGIFVVANYNHSYTAQDANLNQTITYYSLNAGINLSFVKSKDF